MKLKELLEDISPITNINNMIELVSANCGTFLNESNAPLYRGLRPSDTGLTKLSMGFYEGKVRTDRQPKDTSLVIHDALNRGFKRLFGKALRSESLFCSKSDGIANVYAGGNTFLIFPKGDFNVYWSSDISDAYDTFGGSWGGSFSTNLTKLVNDAIDKLNIEAFTGKYGLAGLNDDEKVKILDYILNPAHGSLYTEGNLEAAPYHHEIMVVCKEYYAINLKYLKDEGLTGKEFLRRCKAGQS